ncbi:MAG: hypothetical protein ACK5TB_00570, partial [bacterium]
MLPGFQFGRFVAYDRRNIGAAVEMEFLRLYGRVLRLLAADRAVAIGLVLAALAIAGLQFLEPVLFGRVIDLLARSDRMQESAVWAEALSLLI